MMLKKITRVEIKDPQLKKTRHNLRVLILHMFRDQESFLEVLWHAAEGEEEIKLLRQLEKFRREFRKSICTCSICSVNNNDMVYFPRQKEWVCVECVDNDLVLKEYYY